MERIVATALCLLLVGAPAVAADGERASNSDEKAPAVAPSSKTEPEPEHLKAKIDKGLWQRLRWHEKSLNARSEKELQRKLREAVKQEPSERDVDLPDRF